MELRRKTIFAGVVILFVSCATCVALADDAVLLRYKMNLGDRDRYRCRAEMKQDQTVMGAKYEHELVQDAICSRQVEAIDPSGDVRLIQKFERFKLDAKFAQVGEYSFDSQSKERDNASLLGTALTPILERLSSGALRVVATPRGEVKEVLGYEELVKDLLENNPLGKQLTSGGSNEAAKLGYQDHFVLLAIKPVKPGDTWEVPWETTLPNSGTAKGKRRYRYVGPDRVGDRATAKIEATFEMSFNVDIDMGEAKVSGAAAVTHSKGTIQFDAAAGRLVSIQSNFTIAGDLTVETGGQKIPIKTEQTQKFVMELLERLPD